MHIRVDKSKQKPYLVMNKTVLTDPKLSLQAMGLHCYLLSLPDDWIIYEKELLTHFSNGRDSLRATIKELVDAGYITKSQTRDSSGKLSYCDYVIREEPTVDWKPVDG